MIYTLDFHTGRVTFSRNIQEIELKDLELNNEILNNDDLNNENLNLNILDDLSRNNKMSDKASKAIKKAKNTFFPVPDIELTDTKFEMFDKYNTQEHKDALICYLKNEGLVNDSGNFFFSREQELVSS